ncbi:hypothetical protein HDV03_004636 [Kappamyces sp. JEL0829]|nr:hypothetical protein HDV03_004636 [Kappamyces sp. JEL0829]
MEGDMLTFPSLVSRTVDLIICMGDSLTHLATLEEVNLLFSRAWERLESGGSFVVQFRDLSKELTNGDRFIPVRSDERTVFTCFLEWEPLDASPGAVADGSGREIKVHDLVHVKKGIGAWELCTSWYRKLGLTGTYVQEHLAQLGFSNVTVSKYDGMVFVSAAKMQHNH